MHPRLRSKDTVRRYVNAWASTGLPKPVINANNEWDAELTLLMETDNN